MSMALGGNLRDFGIAEVFQLIGQQRKTGVLEISDGDQTMRLAFDAGAVVWATPVGGADYEVLGQRLVRSGQITAEQLKSLSMESETSARPLPVVLTSSGAVSRDQVEETLELLTRETIFDVLRWTDGSFHFIAQTVNHRRPQDRLLAAEQILMDGLRMMDEWRTFADRVPDDGAVYHKVGSMDAYRQQVSGDVKQRLPVAERIYQLVDGRLPVRRVIDLSMLGTFEATRVLVEMADAGIVAPLSHDALPSTGRKELSLRPVVESVGTGLAAALPLALLALLVSMAFGMVMAPAPPPAGHPISLDPLAAAQQAFDKRRHRNAIEAQRFLTGAWPESLAEADGAGLVDVGALTDASGSPYYYARSEGGVLLLSPER